MNRRRPVAPGGLQSTRQVPEAGSSHGVCACLSSYVRAISRDELEQRDGASQSEQANHRGPRDRSRPGDGVVWWQSAGSRCGRRIGTVAGRHGVLLAAPDLLPAGLRRWGRGDDPSGPALRVHGGGHGKRPAVVPRAEVALGARIRVPAWFLRWRSADRARDERKPTATARVTILASRQRASVRTYVLRTTLRTRLAAHRCAQVTPKPAPWLIPQSTVLHRAGEGCSHSSLARSALTSGARWWQPRSWIHAGARRRSSIREPAAMRAGSEEGGLSRSSTARAAMGGATAAVSDGARPVASMRRRSRFDREGVVSAFAVAFDARF